MHIIGKLFGLIFALAFAGMGVLVLSQTAYPTYRSWQAMQQWLPGQGQLLEVTGAENETRARYRYAVDNKIYQNDRVYVATFNDNIGSYHRDLQQHLQSLQSQGRPVGIWYNPDNPAESVIDRNMRWGLFALSGVFSSVFILIGLAVSFAVINGKNTSTATGQRLSLLQLRRAWLNNRNNPDYSEKFLDFALRRKAELTKRMQAEQSALRDSGSRPWLENKAWRDNRIRSGVKSGMWVLWGFAIFWNAVSAPILFTIGNEIDKGNHLALLGLLFPLLGVLLIGMALRSTREWRRFGIVELQLDPFPGSIGGNVGGTLVVRNIHSHNPACKVELQCVYTYVSGSGKNRSRREDIKWTEAGLARVEALANGVRLKFRFDVPDNLPEADVEQKGAYHFWRLKVSADLPGADLHRDYNIPVFRTHSESQFIEHDISAQVEQQREQQAEKIRAALERGNLNLTDLHKVLRYKTDGNRISFHYPMFRNKVLTLIALMFGAGFSFAAYSITNDFFDHQGMWRYVMLVFSMPFALVGLSGIIAAFYLALNNLSVDIAGKKIKAVRRLFVFPVRSRVVSLHEIKDLRIKSSGSTGQGSRKTEHYKVIIDTVDGGKVTVAEDIDGKDLANQFKDFIFEKLRYSY